MDRLIKTLPAILKASGAPPEVAEAACIAAWKHAVGDGLSTHAAPVQLQHKTLVVVVADNMWRAQLEQMRGQLLFRLNRVVGQEVVKSIEFRVDARGLARIRGIEESKNKATAAVDHQIPVELLTAAAGIADVELRRAFLGAASSCVRRLENAEGL